VESVERWPHRGIVVRAVCPLGVSTDMLNGAGEYRVLLTADGALTPEHVAEALSDGIHSARFLILPHAR
jgi:short-subunit dehydrogenase